MWRRQIYSAKSASSDRRVKLTLCQIQGPAIQFTKHYSLVSFENLCTNSHVIDTWYWQRQTKMVSCFVQVKLSCYWRQFSDRISMSEQWVIKGRYGPRGKRSIPVIWYSRKEDWRYPSEEKSLQMLTLPTSKLSPVSLLVARPLPLRQMKKMTLRPLPQKGHIESK